MSKTEFSDGDRISSQLLSARFESDNDVVVRRDGGRIDVFIKKPVIDIFWVDDISNGFKRMLDMSYNIKCSIWKVGVTKNSKDETEFVLVYTVDEILDPIKIKV